MKAIDSCNFNNISPVVSIQPQYNLLERYSELEVLPLAKLENIAVMSWSPLRGGWLTGKVSKNLKTPPENTRIAKSSTKDPGEAWERYNNDRTWKILDILKDISLTHSVSVSSVALKWVMQRPGITSPIIGARTMEQYQESTEALSFNLSVDEMDKLNHISRTEQFYPYEFQEWSNKRR